MSRANPLGSGIGVLAIVPDVWGGPWMPRHHVLTRLAQYFPVVWVEPAQEWRDAWLTTHPAGWWVPKAMRNAALYPELPNIDGFTLYRPGRWLPVVHRPAFIGSLTERLRMAHAVAMLREQGVQRVVLYLWRPEYEPLLDLIPHDLSIYHVDDEYSFDDAEHPMNAQEARLLQRANQVIIHSPALLEKKGQLNPCTAYVPNGVNYSAYATPAPEPADLATIPHPRIGYVGVVKNQLDIPLLLQLAARHPEWSFVLVGPTRVLGPDAVTYAELLRRPNVYALGHKPMAALPAYTQHLDVCLLCYRMNAYTNYIYPLKLHEYLATGRPVVGTPIRSLQEFSGPIALATTPDEWSGTLAEALSPAAQSPAAAESRRAIARAHDWDALVGRIARLCEERLGHTSPEALPAFHMSGVPASSPR